MKKKLLLFADYQPTHFRDAPKLYAGVLLVWQQEGSYYQTMWPDGQHVACRIYSLSDIADAKLQEVADDTFPQAV